MSVLTHLPYNVLHDVLDYCDLPSQLRLASMNSFFRAQLSEFLYSHIMVVDAHTAWLMNNNGNTKWTLVPTSELWRLTASLNSFTFSFIQKIVINTHSTDYDQSILMMYEKIAQLMSELPHNISITNHDVLNLRSIKSFTNFLAQESVQFIDNEDEDSCEIKRKDHKVMNLVDWFVFSVNEFLALPRNPYLEQLNLYVESNAYLHNSEQSENLLCQSKEVPTQNLRRLSRLYLHSPLAMLKFTELLGYLQVNDLKLQTLSLTASHRARNNMMIEFHKIQPFMDLNNLEELELKMSCTRQHECSDNCIYEFFRNWKEYNQQHGLRTNLKKLAIVHYKSLTETTQFKRVVEEFVFSPLFSNLREVYLNFSDSVKTRSEEDWVDLARVCNGLVHLPYLQTLYISSFFNEWIGRLPLLLENTRSSYIDALTNQCNCAECNHTRALFVELARLDKSNNYTHKGRLADVEKDTPPLSVSCSIDFSEVANRKYLQYVAGQLRKQEHCMERNLHSVGSMLLMNEMPFVKNREIEMFSRLLMHSSLNGFCDLACSRAPSLRHLNLGGVAVDLD